MTFKQKIQNLFFPLGSIQKIRAGYLKGYKIRITENSLWSPILGGWEPTLQKIMANVIEKGQTAYDLGANNGLHGLLMAELVGEKGIVYNFEPLKENIEEISENFELNRFVNFKNVQLAISDKEGMESFVVTEHLKQGFISDGKPTSAKTVEVRTTTIDKFIKEGNPGPSFIKIDIEGAEGPALQGFSETIGQYLPLMVIELHSPEQDKEVGKFLKDHRYTAFRFDPFAKLHFREVKDFARTYDDPDGIWGTVFCIPPGRNLSNYNFDK